MELEGMAQAKWTTNCTEFWFTCYSRGFHTNRCAGITCTQRHGIVNICGIYIMATATDSMAVGFLVAVILLLLCWIIGSTV